MEQYYDQKTLGISKPYRDHFNNDSFELFRIHYPNLYEIFPNGYRLIYKDSQKTVNSLFNKLGTNYSAYTYLVNSTIEQMVKTGVVGNSSEINPLQENGYNSIIDYLKNNKEFFSSLLPEMGKLINRSTVIGDRAEVSAEEVLRKIFGKDVEIRHTAGLGQMEDTHGGKDRVIIKNGQAYNVQIKVCAGIDEENGTYYIKHLGAKLYPNVDIMVFKRGNWFYAFRAKDARGITTLEIFGNREGYMIPSIHKILATKLEPTENVQNNT